MLELNDSIFKIEMAGSQAIVTSGKEQIWYDCKLASSSDEYGRPILGSDRWEISIAARAPLSGAKSFLFRVRRILGI